MVWDERRSEALFGGKYPRSLGITEPCLPLPVKGRGACPDLSANLDLCHSHPYSSPRGREELGVTQELASQAGLWHNPTGPGPDLPWFKGD